MADTLLVCEQFQGDSRKINTELVNAANTLGGDYEAVLLGDGASEAASALGDSGISKVHTYEADDFYAPAEFAQVIAKLVERNGYDTVLLGETAFGSDLGARLSGRLDAGFINDITGLETEGDRVVVTKPLYAGKVISRAHLKGDGVQLYSVRPNVFLGNPEPTDAETEEVTVDLDEVFGTLAEIKPKEEGEVSLTEAEIVISGGRGVGGPEGFKPIFEFADKVGAAVGASRATVDSGWIDHDYQVGQTGKVVNPKLYIACGISGAIQHIAGMRTSKYIVAVNTNPDAPIFNIADYGIVEDLFDVVPVLGDKMAEAMNS